MFAIVIACTIIMYVKINTAVVLLSHRCLSLRVRYQPPTPVCANASTAGGDRVSHHGALEGGVLATAGGGGRSGRQAGLLLLQILRRSPYEVRFDIKHAISVFKQGGIGNNLV